MFNKNCTDKVTLRSIETTDIFDLWKIAFDGDLEWMKWNGPYLKDPVLSLEAFTKLAEERYVNNPFAAVVVYENQIVGQVFAFWEDGTLKQWLEFGICLYDQSTWNKGIGSEVIQCWITYLFETVPLIQRVGFTTWSGNKGMMKIGEKLGMVREAQIRKVRYYQEKYYDSIKYGVLREEWQ
ncbi:GNAT family N-acetyltransferase [Isobaculum melis]|uniref:Protein N-acetyltransferase, RimJ/RimL family n=1 Tax=Isobaculum melis TaxID=142588 RepID=A0A1H9PN74_9LACT|nr:GNAT family protein [Isobaculum melis]SER49540.1 Protein N-acetyltransferase, RimJ/RimL family [Isobaculum melis]